MILGLVKGHVVSSAKVDALEGEKLLIVEILAATPEGLQRTQKHIVCIDGVQAGEGRTRRRRPRQFGATGTGHGIRCR